MVTDKKNIFLCFSTRHPYSNCTQNLEFVLVRNDGTPCGLILGISPQGLTPRGTKQFVSSSEALFHFFKAKHNSIESLALLAMTPSKAAKESEKVTIEFAKNMSLEESLVFWNITGKFVAMLIAILCKLTAYEEISALLTKNILDNIYPCEVQQYNDAWTLNTGDNLLSGVLVTACYLKLEHPEKSLSKLFEMIITSSINEINYPEHYIQLQNHFLSVTSKIVSVEKIKREKNYY